MTRDLPPSRGLDRDHTLGGDALPLIDRLPRDAENLREFGKPADRFGGTGQGNLNGGLICHAAIGKAGLPYASSDNYLYRVSEPYHNAAMENPPLHMRIKMAREFAGLTQAEVAKIFGISRTAVTLWETPKAKGGNAPTADKLGRFAAETGVRGEWLISGEGSMELSTPAPVDVKSNSRNGTTTIPVMGTAESVPGGPVEWNGESIDEVGRPPFLAGAKGAYALYVTGSSMEPRYNAGETIYVHPGRPRLPNDYVVVLLSKPSDPGKKFVLIRQFISQTEQSTTFLQLKPRKTMTLPTAQVLEMHTIVGSGRM